MVRVVGGGKHNELYVLIRQQGIQAVIDPGLWMILSGLLLALGMARRDGIEVQPIGEAYQIGMKRSPRIAIANNGNVYHVSTSIWMAFDPVTDQFSYRRGERGDAVDDR
jgi:hypothetical protein